MSNKFNAGIPLIKSPAYCKSLKIPLPPLIPVDGPADLQGFASWMDLPAADSPDIAMYATLPRVGITWKWSGGQTLGDFRLVLIVERLAYPNPWEVTVQLWRSPINMEAWTFPPFYLQTSPIWQTPLLTITQFPGDDYISAQASA